jgi:hypothetical protein
MLQFLQQPRVSKIPRVTSSVIKGNPEHILSFNVSTVLQVFFLLAGLLGEKVQVHYNMN